MSCGIVVFGLYIILLQTTRLRCQILRPKFYHGEYKDYANLLEISEKDGKKEIKEDYNESIQQQFDDSDNITDKGIADYTEKLLL